MNILVVGYGSIGKRHIQNLLNFKNVHIFVLTKRSQDSFLKQNKIQVFNSLKKALSENIDVAIIANTTDQHVKTSYLLAKSGVDLLIEKPLSNSTRDLKKLFEITQKNKIITLMGCVLRFNPFIKKIHDIITKNELGKIIFARVENGSYLPDWHPYENYQKSYASRKDLGGGVVLTAIHEIDYLYWFFGSVAEVISFTGQYSDLKMSVEDLSVSLIKFNNNVISELHLDYFQRPSTRNCKLVGTKGTLLWDDTSNEVKLYNNKTKKWSSKLKIDNYDWNQMYVEEMAYFLNCVKKRQKTFNSVEDGIKTLKIALSIKESSKIKKVKNV